MIGKTDDKSQARAAAAEAADAKKGNLDDEGQPNAQREFNAALSRLVGYVARSMLLYESCRCAAPTAAGLQRMAACPMVVLAAEGRCAWFLQEVSRCLRKEG